jgi:peptidoglycan/xylan/chitin deacetylase (PgdA/CDA1 family)
MPGFYFQKIYFINYSLMTRVAWIFFFCSISRYGAAQNFDVENASKDSLYIAEKHAIMTQFKLAVPGKFGEFVKGVDEDIKTNKNILALTFDACGGPTGDGYDEELINFLKVNKIPATLFVTGLWIDANKEKFLALSRDTLFEIENHGLLHRPCSVDGESLYGIHGTSNVSQAIDEVELNARKIQFYTGRKPVFYRSATAATDEECAHIAYVLKEQIVSYDILSGDAVKGMSAQSIKANLTKNPTRGAIIIMHMNHPERNGYEALKLAIPGLRKKGFTFVKLQHHPLRSKINLLK